MGLKIGKDVENMNSKVEEENSIKSKHIHSEVANLL
jgi:hypothetical protein